MSEDNQILAYSMKQPEFPDDWDKNVKLIIDPSGSLSDTKSVVLVAGLDNVHMLDIHHTGDNSYNVEFRGDTIGTLNQQTARITGKIDLSYINDHFSVCIVSHLSRLPSAMFLLKPQPKAKYDPRKPHFVTIEEFNN